MARAVRAFAPRQAAVFDSGAQILDSDVFPPKLGSVTTLLPSAILKRASRRGGVPSKLLFFAHDLVVCRTPCQPALLGSQLQCFLAIEFGLPDQFFDPVRRFVKNDSAVLDAQPFEGAPPLAAPRRQKADEEKFFAGQARSGKGSKQRGRTRNRNDGNAMSEAQRNQAVAGV